MAALVRVPPPLPDILERTHLYTFASRLGGLDDNLTVVYLLPNHDDQENLLNELCRKRNDGIPRTWEVREGDYRQRLAHYQAAAPQLGLQATTQAFGRGAKVYLDVVNSPLLRQALGRPAERLSAQELFELQVEAAQFLDRYQLACPEEGRRTA